MRETDQPSRGQPAGTSCALRLLRGLVRCALPAVICAGALTSTAAAQSDHMTARKLLESGEILPLEQIVTGARAARPGEVIETELEREDGRYVYEVEILDATGRVWEVKLDAKTGELLEIEEDD